MIFIWRKCYSNVLAVSSKSHVGPFYVRYNAVQLLLGRNLSLVRGLLSLNSRLLLELPVVLIVDAALIWQVSLMLKTVPAVWKHGPQTSTGLAKQHFSKQSGTSGAWDKTPELSCRMLIVTWIMHQVPVTLGWPLQMAYCSLPRAQLPSMQTMGSYNQLLATGSTTSRLQRSCSKMLGIWYQETSHSLLKP